MDSIITVLELLLIKVQSLHEFLNPLSSSFYEALIKLSEMIDMNDYRDINVGDLLQEYLQDNY